MAADALRIKMLAIRRKLASGKDYNKVCMAAARKVITYVWYILSGALSPNRDIRDFYERKLGTSYAEVGREMMTALGHPIRSSFVKTVSAEVYAHLPERSSELKHEPRQPALGVALARLFCRKSPVKPSFLMAKKIYPLPLTTTYVI